MPRSQRLSILSWNLLSPCYFRCPVDSGLRVEAQAHAVWRRRFAQQLRVISELAPDVVALQELWQKPDVYGLVRAALGAEYAMHSATRGLGKEDGVSLRVRRSAWTVIEARPVRLAGSRVLVLAYLQAAGGSGVAREGGGGLGVGGGGSLARPSSSGGCAPHAIVGSIHMSYPSSLEDEIMRLDQARTASQHMLEFAADVGREIERSAAISLLAATAERLASVPLRTLPAGAAGVALASAEASVEVEVPRAARVATARR